MLSPPPRVPPPTRRNPPSPRQSPRSPWFMGHMASALSRSPSFSPRHRRTKNSPDPMLLQTAAAGGDPDRDHTLDLPDECLALIFHSLGSGDRKRWRSLPSPRVPPPSVPGFSMLSPPSRVPPPTRRSPPSPRQSPRSPWFMGHTASTLSRSPLLSPRRHRTKNCPDPMLLQTASAGGDPDRDHTLNLSNKCLALIFHSLGSGDRKRCSLVCRRWLVAPSRLPVHGASPLPPSVHPELLRALPSAGLSRHPPPFHGPLAAQR